MSNSVSISIDAWSKGIDHEVLFWRRWAATKGYKWPEEFKRRLRIDAPLDPKLGALLISIGPKARVLDVGAGPITAVGRVHEGTSFGVTACDPLACLYDQILSEYNINPPTRTEFGTAEDLSSFFDEESFDLIYCQNALDHSFDPVRGIMEMLRVAKKGGYVVLRHSRNEAENESYVGFHQFNFDEDNGRFVIWNKFGRTDVSELLSHGAEVRCSKTPSVEVIIRKSVGVSHPPRSELDRIRIRELVYGIVSFYLAPYLSDRKIDGSSDRPPSGGPA